MDVDGIYNMIIYDYNMIICGCVIIYGKVRYQKWGLMGFSVLIIG